MDALKSGARKSERGRGSGKGRARSVLSEEVVEGALGESWEAWDAKEVLREMEVSIWRVVSDQIA